MQTIEDALLRVSVDENGASLAQLLAQVAQVDYLTQLPKSVITFPSTDEKQNFALESKWTVVDKGDTRVSLTLIDSDKSYRAFPYHFEMTTTYGLEGNSLLLSFYLKNNSNKKMPYNLSYRLPEMLPVAEQKVGEIKLQNKEAAIVIESADFTLNHENKQIIALSNDLELEAEEERTFNLKITVQ